MRKRSRVLPIIMLCLCTFAAYGQQSWQGIAAVARSGEFAAPGMVAAANAFPENTDILVQNAQTGQSVRVTVTQRIQGTASVFLLLSEEAGKQIGLTGTQVIRVEASVVSTLGTDLSESMREEAYSADPDLNPALSVAEEQLLPSPEVASKAKEATVAEPSVEIAQADPSEPVQAAEQESEPSVEEAQEAEALPTVEEQEPAEKMAEVVAEAVQPEPEEQPAAETPEAEEMGEVVTEATNDEEVEATEQEVTKPPATAALTPEEKRLQELADRIPQKQMYMPPRQQEVYALVPEPSPTEEVQEEIAAAEPPGEGAVEVVEEPPVEEKPEEAEPEEAIEAVEEGPPRVSMLGPAVEEEPLEVTLPGPEAAEPDKPSPEGTRLPAPEEETPLTMAPEEPPTGEIAEAVEEVAAVEPVLEEEPVAEVAMAEAAPEQTTGLADTLPSRTYFVQLGAYSTRTLAEKLAGDLTRSYSVTILPASSGDRSFYKVLVGPLNVDESGTLLYQFRSRGFKDAFIRYVE